jgi:predicted ArsR family transcriptional regulator
MSVAKGFIKQMTTRQRILSHLKKTRTASAREIARALNLSAPNVRHHLGVLGLDGRVEVVTVARQGERGRPEKLYSLSQAALGDNLSALTEALLAEAGRRVEWEAVAGRILGAEDLSSLPIAVRLRVLIEKLNRMHYQARWEAGADGPRVIFGCCPYAAVIEKHPELCQMDVRVIENVLGRDVRQLGKIEKAQGLCVFAVR